MDAIEKRALDLLCGEIDLAREDYYEGERIYAGEALRAIIRALTPPEGYVMVPVDPTVEMMEAAGRVVFQEAGQQWSEPAGHAEGFVIETQRLCHAAMLAARPEVPGA